MATTKVASIDLSCLRVLLAPERTPTEDSIILGHDTKKAFDAAMVDQTVRLGKPYGLFQSARDRKIMTESLGATLCYECFHRTHDPLIMVNAIHFCMWLFVWDSYVDTLEATSPRDGEKSPRQSVTGKLITALEEMNEKMRMGDSTWHEERGPLASDHVGYLVGVAKSLYLDAKCPLDLVKMFVRQLVDTLRQGSLLSVTEGILHNSMSMEDYLKVRVYDSGVMPFFALAAMSADSSGRGSQYLPHRGWFHHPERYHKMQDDINRIISLVNDIFSYLREEEDDKDHVSAVFMALHQHPDWTLANAVDYLSTHFILPAFERCRLWLRDHRVLFPIKSFDGALGEALADLLDGMTRWTFCAPRYFTNNSPYTYVQAERAKQCTIHE